MFPFSKRSTRPGSLRNTQPGPRNSGRQLFKRFLALSGGILLLWLALTIMPKPLTPPEAVTFSDEAGTVATSSSMANVASSSLPDLGKITAGLLLAGLLGFAFYWQKKNPGRQMNLDALHSLGKLQLSPNQHIHLIGCGDDALVIGTNNAQITLLHQTPLNQLRKKTEKNSEQTITTQAFSSPSSTLHDQNDFGYMLEQFSLTTQNNSEATQPVQQS